MKIQSRKHFLFAVFLVILGFAGWVVMFTMPPGKDSGHKFYPSCVLYRSTGMYCGGCGGTRALGELAKGRAFRAAAYNMIVVMVWVPLFLLWIVDLFHYGLKGKSWVPWRKIPIWGYCLVFVVFLLFTLMRNIPYGPFQRLAPHVIDEK